MEISEHDLASTVVSVNPNERIYAVFSKEGNLEGFYDTTTFPDVEVSYIPEGSSEPTIELERNPAIPANCIEVTEEKRKEMMERPQKWKFEKGEIKEVEFIDRSHVPGSVTRWQFAGQAASEGIITMPDAKKWVGQGTVPQVLLDAVHSLGLSEDYKDSIELFLMGTSEFPRNHELTPLLAQFFHKTTEEELDQFFIDASKR